MYKYRRIIGVGVTVFSMVGIVILLNVLFSAPPVFRGTTYAEPFPVAAEIVLDQGNGIPFRLEDQRGRIVLLFFGFTSCPDVCPTTLADLNSVLAKIGDNSKYVQVVFVSVDPERDTPEKMQQYAGRFNPTFVGLSGSVGELEPTWQAYGIYREIVRADTGLDYSVNHTARITLVDQMGNMRLSYGFQTPPADIAHDIEILLDD